jgi:hypothetical protein
MGLAKGTRWKVLCKAYDVPAGLLADLRAYNITYEQNVLSLLVALGDWPLATTRLEGFRKARK